MNYCCAAGNCRGCAKRQTRRMWQRLQEALYGPKPPPTKQNRLIHETVKAYEHPPA